MDERLKARLPVLLALAVALLNLLLYFALIGIYSYMGYPANKSAALAFVSWLLGTPISFWAAYYWTQSKLALRLSAAEKREA